MKVLDKNGSLSAECKETIAQEVEKNYVAKQYKPRCWMAMCKIYIIRKYNLKEIKICELAK